ncbi:MAG: YcaO-like family protein [Gaiella sp.]|nr:YcaO-like family protein [Gaiella sp.]
MTATLDDAPFTTVERALERMETAVSPLVGIVTQTISTTHTTDEASLPNCAGELASARRTLGVDTVAFGSGAHPRPARARAAAIGEALERYSALFVPRERLRLTSARTLGDAAVRPSRFALFHPTQLAEPSFPFVAFTEDVRTTFVAATALADGAAAYLPAELCYLAQPGTALRPIAYSTSSGLACAATFTEAVLAALFELVERDAVMLAWKCGLSLPLLDWAGDEVLETHDRRYFGSTGLPFSVLDGSGFLDVPVAIAIVHGPHDSRASLAVGAGAASTIGEAWLKALSEAFGVYRWLRQQTIGRADAGRSSEEEIETFDEHMLFYARPERAALAAFLDASRERRPTAAIAPVAGETPREQIEALVARLARHGVSAYAADVTSPDVASLGVSVARVVAPELCALDVSHRARFLGGRRLYLAAYEAGLVPAPLELPDLNPLPHPFP